MTAQEAYKSLELKFTSANEIPVSRSTISQEEWNAIKNIIEIGISYTNSIEVEREKKQKCFYRLELPFYLQILIIA